MGRLLQAALLVASIAGVASAGSTRKVKVETTPPGASVYIDTIENGAACEATPCTIDAPVGSPTLIIRLDKYEPELIQIDVAKNKRPTPVSVKLKGSVGTIRVLDAPKGALVKVNDVDKGKVGKGPFEIEVPAEPASVIVTFDGKTLAQELVEVEAGGESEITVKSARGTPVAANDGDEEDGAGSDDSSGGEIHDEDTGGDVTKAAEPAAHAPFIEGGVAMDVGFRRFEYTDHTQPFNNDAQVLLGPAIEVWPGRLLGVHPLRGLSLFARVQFGVNGQQVRKDVNGTPTDIGATTLWGAIEVSLRHKWQFGSIGVEANGGFARDQVEFYAKNVSVLGMVPSADYKAIRIGARLSYISRVEPYVAAENRIVMSGGELATRADNSDVSGYKIAAGARTKLGPLGAKVEAAYSKYNWTFSSNSATAAPPGASDAIFWLSVLVGYDY